MPGAAMMPRDGPIPAPALCKGSAPSVNTAKAEADMPESAATPPPSAAPARPSLLRRVHLALRDLMPDTWVVRRNYWHLFGFYPDLKQPALLSEKVNWLKLHGIAPIHTQLADKVAVRPWVAARIGSEHLIRTILTTDKIDDIRPENIPDERFIIKGNNDTGSFFVVTDRNAFDWQACRAQLRQTLYRKFYMVQREYQYRDIPPMVVVEELLEAEPPATRMTDYKLHCHNGKLAFVELRDWRDTEPCVAIYSRDWEHLPYILNEGRASLRPCRATLPRPALFDRMVQIAETLAGPFPLVRVDLYLARGQVWFGELTFTPAVGLERLERIEPGGDRTDIDALFGARFDLQEAKRRIAALHRMAF